MAQLILNDHVKKLMEEFKPLVYGRHANGVTRPVNESRTPKHRCYKEPRSQGTQKI